MVNAVCMVFDNSNNINEVYNLYILFVYNVVDDLSQIVNVYCFSF